MHTLTYPVTIVLYHQPQHVVFHDTKFMSFSVLNLSQSNIGKFIVLLGTSVMSVGLVQILN